MKQYCRKFAMLIVFIVMSISWAACSETDGRRNSSPLNTTYWIEDRAFDLKEGRSSIESAPGSATFITTSVYGPFATGDLNGDGVTDTGVILVQNPGGSGTFYYAAAAIHEEGEYKGTHAFFLGDRIVPMDIEIENSVMKVRYRDRRPEEAMTAEVSVDKTVRLILKNNSLEHEK